MDELVEGYPQDDREIVDGLFYNAYDTFKTIEYYTSSKYLGGQTDSLGRDKPFRNIVNFRVNTAVKATEFDTKDIQLVTDEDGDYVATMLLSRELHDWMKDQNMAKTINDMIYIRPKYGELCVKKIEKDGELKLKICDWRKLIVDPSDPDDGITIEQHTFQPHQLLKKNWDYVEDIVREYEEGKNVEGGEEDGIIVYEAVGYFKVSDVAESDDDSYKLYKVITCKGHLLYSKEIDSIPYKFLSWENVNGRLGRGVVEDGFEAQIWTNDAVIKERDVTEIASRVFFKTTDDKLEDNALIGIDNGSIIHLQDGKDFSLVNALPGSLPQLQAIMAQWDDQYQKVSSSFDSVTGENLPSRTPFRTAAVLNQAGSSMFALRRQEFGIFLTEILYDWVLPYLTKKITAEHILASNFSSEELAMIDEGFANYEANNFIKTRALNGPTPEDMITPQPMIDELKSKLLEGVQKTKSRRTIKIPKGYFENVKYKVDIITTGENIDKAAMFESLNNIFVAYAQNAEAVRNDPVLSKLFERIVDLSGVGISPQELKYNANQQIQPNSAALPGQGNTGGLEGVLPGLPGQAAAGAPVSGGTA